MPRRQRGIRLPILAATCCSGKPTRCGTETHINARLRGTEGLSREVCDAGETRDPDALLEVRQEGDELKARYPALNGNIALLRPDERTMFAAPEGGPVHYQGFHTRVWVPLTQRAGVKGTPHMRRHSYATALIQAGAKTVQTLMGHHSVAFTMDQYADAWPEALESAREKAASLLLPPSGSKTVAGGR